MTVRVGTSVRVSTGQDSKQDYSTPDDLVRAVEARWGKISFDLAADAENSKGPRDGKKNYFDEQDDSLKQEWCKLPSGLLWLNPPFRRIAPWARKCAEESLNTNQHTILLLVPAAIGSNWYADYCWPVAGTIALKGRLCFIPGQPFPKDCMICEFAPLGERATSYEVWDWKRKRTGAPS